MVDRLNVDPFQIRGLIFEFDLIEYDGKKVRTLERFSLPASEYQTLPAVPVHKDRCGLASIQCLQFYCFPEVNHGHSGALSPA